MASAARTKSKPKKDVKKAELKTGLQIAVEHLRRGDRIVTSWHSSKDGEDADLTLDEVLNTGSGRYVNRSVEVKDFDECPGQWRTHVHVNKTMCYDMRSRVWIVDDGVE